MHSVALTCDDHVVAPSTKSILGLDQLPNCGRLVDLNHMSDPLLDQLQLNVSWFIHLGSDPSGEGVVAQFILQDFDSLERFQGRPSPVVKLQRGHAGCEFDQEG